MVYAFSYPVTTDLTYLMCSASFSEVGSRMNVDISSTDGTGTTIPVVSNTSGVTGRRMVKLWQCAVFLGSSCKIRHYIDQESIDWIKILDTSLRPRCMWT